MLKFLKLPEDVVEFCSWLSEVRLSAARSRWLLDGKSVSPLHAAVQAKSAEGGGRRWRSERSCPVIAVEVPVVAVPPAHPLCRIQPHTPAHISAAVILHRILLVSKYSSRDHALLRGDPLIGHYHRHSVDSSPGHCLLDGQLAIHGGQKISD